MISYIVSVLDRVALLNACLASLNTQSGEKEIFVCVNSVNESVLQAVGLVCIYHDATLLRTGLDGGARDCYESAEMAVPETTGEWLCFPSDDSYYVPTFAERVLRTERETGHEFLYSDMLYTSKWDGWKYFVMDVKPIRHHIDKTCFVLKRDRWPGAFPGKKNGGPCEADGELAEQLVRMGVRHGKIPGGALVVHS